MRKALIYIVGCAILLLACKKWVDKPTNGDPRLTKPYCNDPNAVNYNWDFPGVPNDSVCFYPVAAFRGIFIYQDSVFQADNTFAYTQVDTLHIYALNNIKIAILGFCPLGDSVKLTTDKSYTATVDSTLGFAGQLFCRVQDTLQGTIVKDQYDTVSLHINFTVISDTGVTLHAGTAIKQ